MTQAQMVRVGQILNVSKIVVGDINVVMNQYNVDARVINVETGTIVATEGATFATSSYRSSMQNIATKLAGKIAITQGVAVVSTTTSQPRTEPYVILSYLKVFPCDLGDFDDEPIHIIKHINQSQQYGYGTWRLPTNEELQLIRANNLVDYNNYMTKESKRGIVRLVTDKTKGESLTDIPIGYIDLGLQSGSLWKDKNESGLYNYDAAILSYGKKLPSKEQFDELVNSCQWIWIGNGYNVVGPNGKTIFLPAEEIGYCFGGSDTENKIGCYWSSTSYDSDKAWTLDLKDKFVEIDNNFSFCWRFYVRLVQD